MANNLQFARPVIPRWKIALVTYICVVVMLCISLVVLILGGWHPEIPRRMPPFGANARQCEEIFGHPLDTGYNMDTLHRWSQIFYKSGWSVIVSYDERQCAEQFNFSKTRLPGMRPPDMSASEQKSLLEKFGERSIWSPYANSGNIPRWSRADGRAYALYVDTQRWFILMNQAGFDRSAKALNLQITDE